MKLTRCKNCGIAASQGVIGCDCGTGFETVKVLTEEEVREALLDEDGPILLTIREELGGEAESCGWQNEAGEQFIPNDPAIEAAGDRICAAVRAKVLATLTTEDPDA